MTLDTNSMYMIMGIGGVIFMLLLVSTFSGDAKADLDRRLARVGPQGTVRKVNSRDRAQQGSVRSTKDSSIPILDYIAKMMPNPNKLRGRLAKTGKNLTLGEYLLINALLVLIFYLIFHLLHWANLMAIPLAAALGFFLPHVVTGIMGSKRIKKFIGNFPEAIDTMCRGLRSGLPITESIAAVGREMPDPVGIEFHRISDGVRMGRTLEASMWEVTKRIDAPEFRFLIIAMAIQKETGGNLAETLGNLADLIRKRRQLRLKIKAMSSEAKASAMIIGSLPFIMFTLLMIVNSDYMMTMFRETRGKVMLGIALFWMALGWGAMIKMIHFEI